MRKDASAYKMVVSKKETNPSMVPTRGLTRVPLMSFSCKSMPICLTIWHKSLLFNGHGYTVYDNSSGRLVFRVENYACDWKDEMFLMDTYGNVLFTIRRSRKKFSILESWEAYEGDKDKLRTRNNQKPFIRATKAFGVQSCKMSTGNGDEYQMKWSRKYGWSKLYHTTSPSFPVAEIYRKCCSAKQSMLGTDVLALLVQPGTDQAMVMAMVMINDAMKPESNMAETPIAFALKFPNLVPNQKFLAARTYSNQGSKS
ncbi:LURP-one-related [Dillenia turbinata]|uniref:LURP-one-related n=1 Tax=Dillenia turbinata TaxID=194707 RepID=A0AAN8VNN3_9MAGN